MGEKFASNKKLDEFPGPGSYNLRIDKSKSGGKIGISEKSMKSDKVPGPGTYDNSSIKNKKEIKIGISKR